MKSRAHCKNRGRGGLTLQGQKARQDTCIQWFRYRHTLKHISEFWSDPGDNLLWANKQIRSPNEIASILGHVKKQVQFTFGTIKLAIAPENAAIRRRITAIQCILMIEVDRLLQSSLCTAKILLRHCLGSSWKSLLRCILAVGRNVSLGHKIHQKEQDRLTWI